MKLDRNSSMKFLKYSKDYVFVLMQMRQKSLMSIWMSCFTFQMIWKI